MNPRLREESNAGGNVGRNEMRIIDALKVDEEMSNRGKGDNSSFFPSSPRLLLARWLSSIKPSRESSRKKVKSRSAATLISERKDVGGECEVVGNSVVESLAQVVPENQVSKLGLEQTRPAGRKFRKSRCVRLPRSNIRKKGDLPKSNLSIETREDGELAPLGIEERAQSIVMEGEALSVSHTATCSKSTDTPGLLHEDQSFIYGVTVGLGLLLIYNRNEYNKLVELRAQMEILQKDIRNEVYNKYVVFDSPKADKSLSCSTSDSNEVCDQFFKIDSTSESAECRGIAQLEAELEAELELLQLNLQVENLEDLGQRCLQPIQNTSVMGYLGGSFSHECNPQEPRNSKAYGVCPYKLERRLHELLETRQQERIAELESALERAENELHEKEAEICWWKENRHDLSQNKPQVMRFQSMNR